MKFLRWFSRLKVRPLSSLGVGFSYSDREVLRDVSMNLRKGEVVSIIGHSGSGKSTFLKLVAGIISSRHSGKIKIFGRSKGFSKSKFGFVPQEVSFIPDLSIRDNIIIFGLNYGLSESDSLSSASKLLGLLRLDENLSKFPSQLSGGQKVRLNIILSLLHNPDILILDEPFVGLDYGNRKLLWHFIGSMKKKGKSVVLTSHLLTETEEHVDRLVILKDGKVFFSGKFNRLMSKLRMNYVYEIRFHHLSKSNLDKIRKYCAYKDLQIIDSFDRYLMFGVNTSREKSYLTKFFDKLNLQYHEVGFREPNLDEVFLKA